MQLTKNDILIRRKDGIKEPYLDFSKFQQVVEFYDDYKGKEGFYKFRSEQEKIFKLWEEFVIKHNKKWKPHGIDYCIDSFDPLQYGGYTNWLFNHCFKDGLK